MNKPRSPKYDTIHTRQGRVRLAAEVITAGVGISGIGAIQGITAVLPHVILYEELSTNTGIDTIAVAQVAIWAKINIVPTD